MYTLVQTHIVETLFYFIHIILQSYDVFGGFQCVTFSPGNSSFISRFSRYNQSVAVCFSWKRKAQEATEVFENAATLNHKSQQQLCLFQIITGGSLLGLGWLSRWRTIPNSPGTPHRHHVSVVHKVWEPSES